MTTPFLLEIPPRGQIEEIGHHDRRQFIGYHGDPERIHAVESVLRSLEEFAGHRANLPAISAALTRCAPELMAIAAVLVLNQLPKMEDDDAEPLLRKMRELGQPEWMRAIAGNFLLGSELDDQHASSAPKIPEGYVWPKCPDCGCGIWPDGTGHHSAVCVDQHATHDVSRVDA